MLIPYFNGMKERFCWYKYLILSFASYILVFNLLPLSERIRLLFLIHSLMAIIIIISVIADVKFVKVLIRIWVIFISLGSILRLLSISMLLVAKEPQNID